MLESRWLTNLPNRLTMIRIGVVPIILLIYPLGFKPLNLFCGFLFVIASLTDFFDGYIARKYNVQSKFGQIIDPIADKLLSAAGLLVLVHAKQLPVILAGLLLSRDVAISGLRIIAAENRMSIPVSQTGKIKTVFQSAGLSLLIIHQPVFGLPIQQLGMISVWIAVALSLFSAYHYIQNYWMSMSSLGKSDFDK